MQTRTTTEAGGTRQELLRVLLHHKQGLSVDSLAERLGISRNGVRQHLTALERDGLVARGAALPSGGRPEQLFVLTARALEQFPRQYSWFAELLLADISAETAGKGLVPRLEAMARRVAGALKARLRGADLSAERIAALAGAMNELGYDATVATGDGLTIEAYNCVYHSLAAQNPDICAFDLALLSESAGGRVEHQACMVRGGGNCRFRFGTPPASRAASEG